LTGQVQISGYVEVHSRSIPLYGVCRPFFSPGFLSPVKWETKRGRGNKKRL
jgi:hypothetical protein